jgi:predicted nucleic acid-binding protein
MSFLIDTDLLSLLQRKRVPAKLENWIQQNEGEVYVSVVSMAELQFGVARAPIEAREDLAEWVSEIRRKLAPATEPLNEEVLARWKELLADLKSRKRTMSCEDSLIAATALHFGHIVATRNVRHFEAAGVKLVDLLA